MATVCGDTEDIVETAASELADRLGGCGRLRLLPFDFHLCPRLNGCAAVRVGGASPTMAPAIVRCVNDSTLGASWLICHMPDPLHDPAAQSGGTRSKIFPPLRTISDLHRGPSGNGGRIGSERRQLWRAYDRQPTSARVEAGASAALIDDLSVTFESAELALGLVKPFDEDRLATEILLVSPPGNRDDSAKLLACVEDADELARSLGYDVAGSLLTASKPAPVLSPRTLVSAPPETQPQ